ncbi:phosphatase PAP2 family protein [Candidatus Microgenomates bacterium]|nr:phosphatase PAP2 family protein [Candidatus Microgenomates bacterium]
MDYELTLWLQGLIPRQFDTVLSIFSILGTFEIASLALAGLFYWLWRQKKIAWSFLFFFFVLHVIEILGKFFLAHPSPPPSLVRFTFPIDLPTIKVTTSYSFPSGHVSRITYLVVLGIFLWRKKAWFVLLSLAFLILMAITRVYLGEHWASDVIGGLVLGSISGWLALLYYKNHAE